jgi:phosphatidylglycerophosphatase A
MTAATAPTLGFLLRHPAHFIALGFGAGLAPFAPGTFGTLVAIPIAMLLWRHASPAGYVVVVIALLLVGIWAAQVTGLHLGVADHGSIVVDEVVAFLLVLFFVGPDSLRIAIAFGVFRVFDILKPPPIRRLDAKFKSGFGVMIDDLAAAGYTLLVLSIVQRIAG